uniref:Zeaxanthin epoxidaseic-like n=1 Tax=Rhizophora mucronata TaxID=61149 RepID=A0A2P2K8D8_RHIMU
MVNIQCSLSNDLQSNWEVGWCMIPVFSQLQEYSFIRGSHSKFVCSNIGPSLTSLGMITLFLTEQTRGFSHCRSDPTRFARMVKGNTRGHLSLPYDLKASSTDAAPELTAPASFLAKTTASSNAQHPPCPKFGVIGCHASPTSTTLPFEAVGLMAGHSQRSTRGVLLIVSSGLVSIKLNSSESQFLTSSLASFFNAKGSVIFGPAKRLRNRNIVHIDDKNCQD